jgi:hypothetical protein
MTDAALRQAIHELVRNELDRRNKGEGQAAWNDSRAALIKDLISMSNDLPIEKLAGREENRDAPLQCLDNNSLSALKTQASRPTPIIRRDGTRLVGTISLSQADQHQIKVTFETWQKILGDEIAAGRDPRGSKREQLEIGRLFSLVEEKDALRITVDWRMVQERYFSVAALRKARSISPTIAPDEKTRIAFRNTVAAIQGSGIEVKQGVTVDSVIDKFERDSTRGDGYGWLGWSYNLVVSLACVGLVIGGIFGFGVRLVRRVVSLWKPPWGPW